MKRFLLPVAATLGILLVWSLAQPAPAPLASFFPSGALVYLEARDFGSLLADWNGSAEKRNWLASANYDAFSRSQLFLKLSDARTQFAAAAGVSPDDALLASIAGSNSALAIYDIGKLQFLYLTHLPSARAINTSLWKLRGSYETRHAGNADYFVKEDKASQRVAAFAYVGDSLLLATREDLLARALQLMAREPLPSVASESWFENSVQAAAPGAADLRLVYNMASLSRTFQFRSHWVQQNAAALREFSSGLADLERAGGEMRERRVLLRANPVPTSESSEAATGPLLAAVPDDAGFYRATLHPEAAQASHWVEENLFTLTALAAPQSISAPVVADTSDAGSEADLETRIDEPPLPAAGDSLKSLRNLLAGAHIAAMLQVSSTSTADQVFVRPHSALALVADTAWDAGAIRTALGAAAEGVWSNDTAAVWRAAANGVEHLDGLGGLDMASDGKWLILGDSPQLVAEVFARRNRPALAGASYAAGWRHARELPNFERMMTLIDFPQIPAPPADGAQPAGEPLFFSANLASLGRVLHRVDSATIVMHDAGATLRESVVYRLNP